MKIYKNRVVYFGILFIFFLVAIENATAGQTLEKETQLTTNKSFQGSPAIYEDRIIWVDGRNGNTEIYMYNISTAVETRLTNSESYKENPEIYGDRIVWEDSRNGGGEHAYPGDPNGNWDIYMYDLSTQKEIQITTNESYQDHPAIYEDRIVWRDARNGNWNIYMYNISTSVETKITNNESRGISFGGISPPAIYGDRMVWDGAHDPLNEEWDADIYLYNLSTSTKKLIATGEPEQLNPAIYGDRIVYEVDSTLAPDTYRDIYMYNLSTSKETLISASGGINHEQPAIYGDRIIWRDYRNTDYPYGPAYIYMYDLSTQKEIQITTNQTAEGDPAIYKNRIVWEDFRNYENDGNNDIYMFTISEMSMVLPVANFTATPLSGKVPLKVKFTSTSTGSPTAWKWNFGDGSTLSMEQNPEHTYTKSGVYAVKHTAINSAGRDTEIKTKFVTVTPVMKAPVAAFSASPRSGKVPLKVQFTDKSGNNPTSWKWNFGDGKYSTQENPAHIYSKAGKYDITLTVKNAKGSSTKKMSGYIVSIKK